MSVSSPIIQFKRGSASLISSGIVSFRQGEPGFTTDKYDFYIGSDGTALGNKFFGSSRYWTREDGTKSSRVNLVNKDGTNYVSLACTDGHTGVTTYTFPSVPIDGRILVTDGNGNLRWTNEITGGDFTGNVAFTSTTQSTSSSTGAVVITGGLGVGGTVYFGNDLNVAGVTSISSAGFLDVNSNADFSGITTFSSTENNVLGDENTGAVQIDGGVGIAKNLTVKENLYVGGVSEFVGIVTFKGGTINLGDENTDNINVSGEFISNLTPNADNTYDIGITTQRWRDAKFAGIGSFATGVYADNIEIGINQSNEIKSNDGIISLVASEHVLVSNDLHVNGNVTIGGTTVTLLGEDVYIRNKDIILGYTTSVTGTDVSTDTTANHGGVAIASTEGTPLVSFSVSGINTLPDTYKQMMWFQKNTLGFATDVFAFNYGVAIGTTTVADGVRLAVGSGIRMTDSNITTAGDIAINGGDLTTTATTFNLVNANATTVNFAGAATDINIGSTSGITTIRNNLNVNGNTVLGTDPADTLTINANTSFNSTITGTISTATRSTQVDTTGTSDSSTYHMLFADTSAGQQGETVRVSSGATFVPSTNTLSVSILQASTLKSTSGVEAITIAGASGDVGVTTNLTVGGSLTVKGAITSVNTVNLKVKDQLIDLGLVDDGSGTLIPPSSDSNLDVGILLHYYSSGAKKSAVYWDDSATKIVFASDVTDSSGVLSPVGNASGMAHIEIGALSVYDCAGQSQVISCTNSQRFLENITIDGGAF